MAGQFMSVRETAEYLNMSVAWVYRNARGNGMIPYRFGAGRNAKMNFKTSEVEDWIKQQEGAQ